MKFCRVGDTYFRLRDISVVIFRPVPVEGNGGLQWKAIVVLNVDASALRELGLPGGAIIFQGKVAAEFKEWWERQAEVVP